MNRKIKLVKISLLILIAMLSYQCGEVEANPDLTVDLVGQYEGVSQPKKVDENNSLVDIESSQPISIFINVIKLTDTSIEVFDVTDNQNSLLFTAGLERASDGIAIIIDSGAIGYVTDPTNTPDWHGAFQVENNRLVFSTNEGEQEIQGEDGNSETINQVRLYSVTKIQE